MALPDIVEVLGQRPYPLKASLLESFRILHLTEDALVKELCSALLKHVINLLIAVIGVDNLETASKKVFRFVTIDFLSNITIHA